MEGRDEPMEKDVFPKILNTLHGISTGQVLENFVVPQRDLVDRIVQTHVKTENSFIIA